MSIISRIRSIFTQTKQPMLSLFISNISFTSSPQELEDLLAKVGPVENFSVIKDKVTGKSKGFGFAEMSEQDGRRTITLYNGHDFHGRKLVVKEANPRTEK